MAVDRGIYVSDKLTHDERMDIYKWAGEGYTLREICKMHNNKGASKAKIRIPGITRVLGMPEAHKFVSKFRVAFLKNIKEIPISEKKVRLDDLEKMRQRLVHIINNCHLDRSEKELGKFMMASRRLVEVIEMAKSEMEPRNGINIGIGVNQGDMSDLTDEQLQQQRDDILRKAGIAFKRGVAAVHQGADGDEAADKGGPA
jgi:hypothetical protein